ncbi:MAG: polysaccharide biosynthesis/export family protein [Hyphomonas sp.]
MAFLRNVFIAGAMGASLILSACQAGGVAQAGSTDALATRQATPYALGTGDRLRINVFGEDDLSGEFVIDNTGTISLPLIGEVKATGLSTSQLQVSIADALADGYLLEPRVSAEVINFRPFYILGEVRTPGEYPYSANLTVQNAVAAAGGFDYRADKRVVFIKNAESSTEVKYILDANTLVQPGDTIRIDERTF